MICGVGTNKIIGGRKKVASSKNQRFLKFSASMRQWDVVAYFANEIPMPVPYIMYDWVPHTASPVLRRTSPPPKKYKNDEESLIISAAKVDNT
jgi:hypothetical protein